MQLSNRPRTLSVLLLALVVTAVAVACGSTGGAASTGDSRQTERERERLGTIAYVDANGCIARVAATGQQVANGPFCPPTRSGTTFVAWLDGDSVAYSTPESRGLGWRMVDFATGVDADLPIADAPRIFLLSPAPQYRSVRGERIEIDQAGVVYRNDLEPRLAIFGAPNGDPGNRVPSLKTWSPDGEWLLLEVAPEKELWVVRRDGSGARRVAASSRGQASWFMPQAGALPHLDLTCTTDVASSCRVALVRPFDGAAMNPDDTGGLVSLSWSVCPGATGYELQVLAAGSDNPVVEYVTTRTNFRFSLASASTSGAGPWRWKVRALVGPQPGPWSEERAFAAAW